MEGEDTLFDKIACCESGNVQLKALLSRPPNALPDMLLLCPRVIAGYSAPTDLPRAKSNANRTMIVAKNAHT